jgi:4-alpha-glucanotransferase
VYSQLIDAEVRTDKSIQPRVVRTDFDADLQDELLMESPDLNVYVRPAYGGAVSELDDRRKRVNLLNVLARRDEGYHDRLREAAARYGHDEGAQPKSIHDLAKVKEPGLEKLLVSDQHLRLAFVDHFFAPGTTLDAVAGCTAEEAGDFVGAAYKVVRAEGPEVQLEREGRAYGRRVRLRKTFRIDGRKLTVAYAVQADDPVEALFAADVPLFLDTAEHRAAGRAEMAGLHELRLFHDWLGMNVIVRFSPEATVWRFPLEAASQSEGGFERTYQGTVFVPVWKAALGRFEPKIEIELVDA